MASVLLSWPPPALDAQAQWEKPTCKNSLMTMLLGSLSLLLALGTTLGVSTSCQPLRRVGGRAAKGTSWASLAPAGQLLDAPLQSSKAAPIPLLTSCGQLHPLCECGYAFPFLHLASRPYFSLRLCMLVPAAALSTRHLRPQLTSLDWITTQ